MHPAEAGEEVEGGDRRETKALLHPSSSYLIRMNRLVLAEFVQRWWARRRE